MPEREVRENATQMPANGEGYLPGKGKNTFTHRTLEQDSSETRHATDKATRRRRPGPMHLWAVVACRLHGLLVLGANLDEGQSSE